VHQIAVCRWKLGRAWRYENAEITNAVVDAHHEEFRRYTEVREPQEKEEQEERERALTRAELDSILKDADEGIDAGKGVPPDFQTRLAAIEFPLDKRFFEMFAHQQMAQHPELQTRWTQDLDSLVAYLSATAARRFLDPPPDPVPFREKLRVACE